MLLIIGQSTVIVRSCTFGLSLSGPALSVGHCQVLHFRSVIVRSCTFGRSLSGPALSVRHCQVLHFRSVIVRSCTFGRSLSGPALSVRHCQVLHFWSVIVIGDTTFIWSGRNDGKHQEGVALAVQRKLMSACVSWTPINERLLRARFRHVTGFLSFIVVYAPTENADTSVKEQFYAHLEVAIAQRGKNDLKMILGDFNAVTGSSRIQGDTALGPWGSGTPNVNTDLLYCHSAGGTISALQDLGSRERIFTASLGFTTMGKLGRRLITYLRLAAKWFDSAEFVAVSTLTLTIFLCWRL